MAAPQQVFHSGEPTACLPGTPLREHLLYGPPALYYLGVMQRWYHFLGMRRLSRVPLQVSNFPIGFSLAGVAASRTRIVPTSPVGQA